MSIPDFDDEGFLPPSMSPYRATVDELHNRCVKNEPNEEHRESIFAAFLVHADRMRRLGFDRVWVNGGFVTRKLDPPKDIDLVYPASSIEHMAVTLETPGIEQLITQCGVIAEKPLMRAFNRLQPMGGLVDATVCSPNKFEYWLDMWATIKRNDGAADYSRRKGFLEVGLQ